MNPMNVFVSSRLLHVVLVFLSGCFFASGPSAVAQNREAIAPWKVVEHFGLNWPQQAVHMSFDTKTAAAIAATGKPVRVVDQAGKSVPGQLVPQSNPKSVWYLASLQSGEEKVYHLENGAVDSPRPLSFTKQKGIAQIANDSFSVRISWAQDVSYPTPQRLDALDGPIRQLRGPDGVWYGQGSWEGDARCRAFRCRVVEHGPVLVVVQQTYVLASGEELTFEYRVDAATPGVTVTQQCSGTPDITAKWDFYKAGQFEPSHAFWRAHSADAWHGKREGANWFRQVYALRWPETPDVVTLHPFFQWSTNYAPFWSCWSEQEDRRDMLLVSAIRPSQARCTEAYQPYTLATGKEGGEKHLTLTLKLQKGRKLFFLGMLDRQDALPKPYAASSKIESLYRQMQCLSLDDYQQMNVEWDGMDQIRFPRLMVQPEELDSIRENYKNWPELREKVDAYLEDQKINSEGSAVTRLYSDGFIHAKDWAGAYLATGDLDYARKAKQQLGKQLDEWVRDLAGVGPTVNSFIGPVFARPWRAAIISFDLIASSDAFTNAERIEYLRKIAFLAEIASTGDAWPPAEAGIGTGPPNFHADYFSGKGLAAALLSGHPRQRAWMDYAIQEASQFLKSYHFSSGCANEAATYQLVSLNYMFLLSTAVQNAGGADLFSVEPMFKKSFDHLASTQTPRDPRTGFCMLPTLGHVTTYGWCQSLQVYFAWAAKATAASDPAFSQRMMAAWKRAGSLPISLHDFVNGIGLWQPICLIDRTLPSEPDPTYHRSKLLEGLGAIFRSEATSGEQGYLLVKMGPSRGHYDADEGSLIWYAYGKPLLIDFGCQYNPSIQYSWLHNRISFDHWNNPSYQSFNITNHSFGEHVDYLKGEIIVSRLDRWTKWPIRDPDFDSQLPSPSQTIRPVAWRRHVLYLRECETVVILDELEGEQPTEWNIQVLADEVEAKKNSSHFKGQLGVDLDVYFAQPEDPEIRISSFEHLGFNEPRIPFPWWRSMRWAAPEGTSFGPLGERALTLRTRSATQSRYLTLLRARHAEEPAPTVQRLPDGSGFQWSDKQGEWSVQWSPAKGVWNVSAQGAQLDWTERIE